jgi:hypothetical protein
MALLAPHIANGIVLLINAKLIKYLSLQADESIKQGSFKILPILHHFTAGLKALAGEM